jgi:hypothetical protein
MDYRIAEFVRYVEGTEQLDDLVNEAKADTWTKEREHTVLIVRGKSGQDFVMVRGGRDGILLTQESNGEVSVEVEGTRVRVLRLAWHVHPQVTGPSDHDRRVLDELGQEQSMLFEIGGPREGTLFKAMSKKA